jgi:uncharacterized membrane protein YfcA
MNPDITWMGLLLLFGGGILAGVINTLAGNGSAITLSTLIFLGLPADWANATNRIGVIAQTTTAVASLKRTSRNRLLLFRGKWLMVPTVLGSLAGAVVATWTRPDILEWVIFAVMAFILWTLIQNPGTWLQSTDVDKHKRSAGVWFTFFAIGFYGGFIQMGIGILMLASLVLSSGFSLRDANVIKLLQALVLAIPPIIIFWWDGKMHWEAGIALAVGQSIGAIAGTRYFLRLPGANQVIRWVLMLILVVALVQLGVRLIIPIFAP